MYALGEDTNDINLGDSIYIWSETSTIFFRSFYEYNHRDIEMSIINEIRKFKYPRSFEQLRIIPKPAGESLKNPSGILNIWIESDMIDWFELLKSYNVE